ncbi:hypothetical protein [Jeotgalibacillus proteolyticus]|uniref:Uncharacterized protein n=1 Tax=Jeotgalibacillus proteolyticus TaxID=2082395 RepID=A0A2S5GFZ4_9BACL|nr:hypothetical protein [Jeotgalibacillus proteolyticus]PPA71919.1 hypothetical protein C4B60_00645 [Jeotgalibacillus proteolyticus]
MKINLTFLIGCSFIMLATLRATDLVDYHGSFVSSIALAGLFFLIADLISERIKFEDEILNEYKKMENHIKKVLFLMKGRIRNEKRLEIESNLDTIQKKIDSTNEYRLLKFLIFSLYMLAVMSIVVFPQLTLVKSINSEGYGLIGDFTVLLGLGITLILAHIRDEISNGLEGVHKRFEGIKAYLTELIVEELTHHYTSNLNDIYEDDRSLNADRDEKMKEK